MDDRMATIITNKLIAEGIDTILSKNIENYYNSVVKQIQLNILKYKAPELPALAKLALAAVPLVELQAISDTLLPIAAEKPFKLSFSEVNDKLFEVMTNVKYYDSNISLIDLDMMTMEMASKDDIDIE